MEKIEVTWPLALKIWWSFTWRSFLLIILGTIVFSMPAIFILGALSAPKETAEQVGNVLGLLLSIPFQIYVMKKILNKKYKTFSIALIREQ